MGYDEIKEPSGKVMIVSDTANFKNLTKELATHIASGWRVSQTWSVAHPSFHSKVFVLLLHD